LRTRLIAVVGGGHCSPHESDLAEEVGRRLAEAGFGVVCGGLNGVMAAACRGCAEAGGLTVGLLPGHDPAEANPWVRVPVATGLGEDRNALVVNSGEAVIAVGGEFGTLSEIALALQAEKTVVGLGIWKLEMAGVDLSGLLPARDAIEAVGMALKRIV
jgi:uncharacterized protein (TIGR00725 family)